MRRKYNWKGLIVILTGLCFEAQANVDQGNLGECRQDIGRSVNCSLPIDKCQAYQQRLKAKIDDSSFFCEFTSSAEMLKPGRDCLDEVEAIIERCKASTKTTEDKLAAVNKEIANLENSINTYKDPNFAKEMEFRTLFEGIGFRQDKIDRLKAEFLLYKNVSENPDNKDNTQEYENVKREYTALKNELTEKEQNAKDAKSKERTAEITCMNTIETLKQNKLSCQREQIAINQSLERSEQSTNQAIMSQKDCQSQLLSKGCNSTFPCLGELSQVKTLDAQEREQWKRYETEYMSTIKSLEIEAKAKGKPVPRLPASGG